MPLFAELDQLKAELDALPGLPAEQQALLLQKCWLEWNYHSNALEGNSLTLTETHRLLRHELTAAGKPLRDHLRMLHHDKALHRLEEAARDLRPLSESLLQELSQLLRGAPVFALRAGISDGRAPPRRATSRVLVGGAVLVQPGFLGGEAMAKPSPASSSGTSRKWPSPRSIPWPRLWSCTTVFCACIHRRN
jgi:hypothetical protein